MMHFEDGKKVGRPRRKKEPIPFSGKNNAGKTEASSHVAPVPGPSLVLPLALFLKFC